MSEELNFDKLQINEVPDPEILPGHVLINNKAGK